jgi:DNA-binding XRE family transcriptional regulator
LNNKEGGHNMQEFNKVKSIRVGAGITQDQMAKVLGISVPTYLSRENGVSDWRLTEMNTFTETINNATGKNYSVKDIFF